jgi:hypothetical protein
MIGVRMDSMRLNEILGNSVKYSYGFLEGVDLDQILFNKRLGEFTEIALGQYVDAQARMNPSALHHVYEWGAVGSEGARLFKFHSTASKRVIHITGEFLPSKSYAEGSNEPFRDKANVMENAISVVIAPKNSPVLVFEDEGETVFTVNEIYIANPGGDAVAGSFGRVVDDFFGNYFTGHLLKPFIAGLGNPTEYARMFPQGAKGGGRRVGLRAARDYLTSAGSEVEIS